MPFGMNLESVAAAAVAGGDVSLARLGLVVWVRAAEDAALLGVATGRLLTRAAKLLIGGVTRALTTTGVGTIDSDIECVG